MPSARCRTGDPRAAVSVDPDAFALYHRVHARWYRIAGVDPGERRGGESARARPRVSGGTVRSYRDAFEARISTEFDVGLPDSACVYCGNCIGVCPTGALMFASEYKLRQAGEWDESKQTVTTTICPTAASAAISNCTSRTIAS
jgi:ferredoxin